MVATWIAEVERERKRLERELRGKPVARTLTRGEIKALVRQLKDIVAVLANANPADKRAIYDEQCVNLTCHPGGNVHVGRWPCTSGSCRRGDLNPHALNGH